RDQSRDPTEIRRREPQLSAPRVAVHHGPGHTVRPPEDRTGTRDVSLAQRRPHRRRRPPVMILTPDVLDRHDLETVLAPEPDHRRQRPGVLLAEPHIVPDDDGPRPERLHEIPADELL